MANGTMQGNERVLIQKDGERITVTAKAFTAVYKDKGFEIVDRESAAKASPARTSGEKPTRNNAPPPKSAADIAAGLGLKQGENAS
jgi:hypothetical protein